MLLVFRPGVWGRQPPGGEGGAAPKDEAKWRHLSMLAKPKKEHVKPFSPSHARASSGCILLRKISTFLLDPLGSRCPSWLRRRPDIPIHITISSGRTFLECSSANGQNLRGELPMPLCLGPSTRSIGFGSRPKLVHFRRHHSVQSVIFWEPILKGNDVFRTDQKSASLVCIRYVRQLHRTNFQ